MGIYILCRIAVASATSVNYYDETIRLCKNFHTGPPILKHMCMHLLSQLYEAKVHRETLPAGLV
jgi:hypothetical protein